MGHPAPVPARALVQAEAQPVPEPRPDRAPRAKGVLAIKDEVTWLASYLDETKLTKAGAADAMGIDRSTLSKVLDGTYGAQDLTAMLDRIRAFRLKIEGPDGLSAVIGFRETRTVRLVFDAYAKARTRGELLVLVGEGGEGKTWAFREIIRRANKAGQAPPVYICCNVFTSAYALALRLSHELGVGRRETADATLASLADKLRYQPRVLIVDEINYVARKAADVLRWLRDETGIGILLAGNTALNGAGGRTRAGLLFDLVHRHPDVEPLFSRARVLEMPGVFQDEAEAIATDVLGAFSPNGMERLLARTRQSIRLLVRMVEELRELKKGVKGPIGASLVDEAWKRLYARREAARAS
jgi:DNA transposition AAA+ family ATPase